MTVRIMVGDSRQLLKALPATSVHCVVTSPPYWGLRDYGVAGQIGLEKTPQEFVQAMVEIFREVHRVLRPEGTCWVNLGDTYFSDGGHTDGDCLERRGAYRIGRRPMDNYRAHRKRVGAGADWNLKPKDLCMIPARVAIALQEDGWWLRSDVVWNKPNGMPEAVKDRPVRAHEFIFLLTKSERYFYDSDATREPAKAPEDSQPEDIARAFNRKRATTIDPRQDSIVAPPQLVTNGNKVRKVAHQGEGSRTNTHLGYSFPWAGTTALKRDVWTVTSKPFKGAHFATFPPDLIEPCIKAGTSAHGACSVCGAPWQRQVEKEFIPQPDVSEAHGVRGAGTQKPLDASNGLQGYPRGTSLVKTLGWAPSCKCELAAVVPCIVLDPFGGAGTTGLVADRLGRDAVLLELNPEYAAMTKARLQADGGMMTKVESVERMEAIA